MFQLLQVRLSFKRLLALVMWQQSTYTGQQVSLPVSPANYSNLYNSSQCQVHSNNHQRNIWRRSRRNDAGFRHISLISTKWCNVLQSAQNVVQMTAARPIQLVTASGDQSPILQHVKVSVKLGSYYNKDWTGSRFFTFERIINMVHDF